MIKTEVKEEESDVKFDPDEQYSSEDQLRLSTLDVESILSYGKELLASAGQQYDFALAGLNPAERLAHQKKTLTSRLGLAGEYIEEDLVNAKDLTVNHTLTSGDQKSSPNLNNGTFPTHPHSSFGKDPNDQASSEAMSKRQLNMLKRRRKEELKRDNKKFQYDFTTKSDEVLPSLQEGIKPEIKDEDEKTAEYFSLERRNGDDDTRVVSEFKGAAPIEKSALQVEMEEGGKEEWPFERLCEFLTIDLFDPRWEIRHGAAMGIREIIRSHGAGAGKIVGKSRLQNERLNQAWLDDLACRLSCILMLDRFADYVSDTAIAPIRETAGQALGVLFQFLSPSSVQAVNKIFYRLIMQKDLKVNKRIWHACHGGMIGMRYLVAVRSDLLMKNDQLLDGVLECVIKGLADNDDDVRAVSAATLIPVANEFITQRPAALSNLIQVVWACLSDLSDDLSASTGAVMDLLAKLCSFPQVLDAMKKNALEDPDQSFGELVPRLFPFFRHTIITVRSAVLRALLTFLDIQMDHGTNWVNGKALRLMYQNLLMERNEGVLKLSLQVWISMIKVLANQDNQHLASELREHLAALIQLTLHPIGVSRHPIPMNVTLIMRPSGHCYQPTGTLATRKSPHVDCGSFEPAKKRRKTEKPAKEAAVPSNTSHNIDAHMMHGDVDLVGIDVMIRTRTHAAKALGILISLWPSDMKISAFLHPLLQGLDSPMSTTQLFAAIVIEEYAKAQLSSHELSDKLSEKVLTLVEEERPTCYGDLTSYLQIVRAQCQVLLNTFRDKAQVNAQKLPTIAVVVQCEPEAGKNAFSLANAQKLVGTEYDRLVKSLSASQRITASESLTTAKFDADTAIAEAITVNEQRDVRIKAAAAASLISFNFLPKKPQNLIKALMDSVKDETNAELQKRSACSAADLVNLLQKNGRGKIVDKIVGNLVKFYCMETGETPEFHVHANKEAGILSLQKDEDIQEGPDPVKYEREARAAKITKRGAKEALDQLCVLLGEDLFEKVPTLRLLIEQPIRHCFTADIDNSAGQEVVDALSSLRALLPSFHVKLHDFVIELMPLIIKAMRSRLAVLRYAAAKCFASICSTIPVKGFTVLVDSVLPFIGNPEDLYDRQGIVECIYHLIHVMEDDILPYVIFLLVPVLGRMSDSDNGVRLIATTAFATLVKLVPLEAGIPDPPGLSEQLLKGREKERKFIAQMLDPKKVEPFTIPVAIKAQLRSYQQEGVNWLAFLNRYHLHGVLCDDMGLGKTLQTLCMVASDHHMRAEEYEKTGDPNSRKLPSLIVCPPTLSGHWQQELRTYAPFLKAVAYVGPPSERGKVRDRLLDADVVITSYDICRNDADILGPVAWNYCVLDEGHLIKNPKAKTTMAVKKLVSNHRLILSGTPIQNNVLELWSLFDFLMPGFLGTEKVFQDRFAKPIAASRFSKSSSKEQEAGALAIEALHKQVLPFLLRRLKEEVLNDLPPKILQNYYCDLSDLQKKLFEDFTRKEGSKLAQEAGSGDKEAKQHIFQALQYMRKLCNSPAMVMKEGHKQYDAIQAYLAARNTSLKDPIHAPKLTALRDLLVDCGIGTSPTLSKQSSTEMITADQAVSPHRALIFCQMKEMLDMVEDTVLRKMLPSVTFSRLDGSVEASKRQDIVNNFNSDPSIDCLLLTTSVGGLGLNLTGADTVIFVEHDWNPQKDLQAMDRAHRIGQKKVVNVYRLITRGTLEEKILK